MLLNLFKTILKTNFIFQKIESVLINYIEKQDRQSFVIIGLKNKGNYNIYDLKTQNEKKDFLNKVEKNENIKNNLVLAIIDSINKEIYDGADKLLKWVFEENENNSVSVQLKIPIYKLCLSYRGFPVYVQSDKKEKKYETEKISILIHLLDLYYSFSGNDDTRLDIIEVISFGLCRILGKLKRFKEALVIVERAIKLRPYSLSLKSANYALKIKIENRLVPGRLNKFIGGDDGYMLKYKCPEPFTRFDIGPNGDVSVCCGHWVNKQIGNFTNDTIDSIINSNNAVKIRKSIDDGTYKYCNHLECRLMIHDEIPLKTSKENLELQSKLIKNRHSIEQVLFAYDSSCNLSCPSCRKVKIMEKATEANAKVIAVTEKLLPILGGLKVININPAGELFASKASRRILQYISDETCKDLKIEIISNGTLFNEDEWNKFPGIHNKIKSVRISIDAATKLTFEKLRRLAYYDIFMDNMQFISKLKNNNTIPQLQFSFTYQLDNYNEMPEFVNFGRSMNADLVIFERLQNLGAYTNDEYRHRAVHLYGHDKYFEFINIIQQPIMQQSYVMNDFQI